MAIYRRRVDNRHSGLAWRVILPHNPISKFTLTTSQCPITHSKRFGLLITRPLTRLILGTLGHNCNNPVMSIGLVHTVYIVFFFQY